MSNGGGIGAVPQATLHDDASCNLYQLYDGSGQRQGCDEMSVGFASFKQFAVSMLSGTDARAVFKKRNICTIKCCTIYHSSFDCNTSDNQTTLINVHSTSSSCSIVSDDDSSGISNDVFRE